MKKGKRRISRREKNGVEQGKKEDEKGFFLEETLGLGMRDSR